MEKHGQEMIDMFSKGSAQNKELLAGVVLRSPDVISTRRKRGSIWRCHGALDLVR